MEPRGWFVGLVLIACAAVALSGLALKAAASEPVALDLQGIVHTRSGQDVAILAERGGARRLPVPVSRIEAQLIERARRGQSGLTQATIDALGGRVVRASIDGMADDRALRGHLCIASGLGRGEVRLDAAPGEALALAMQAGAPIEIDPVVLDEAGLSLDHLRGRSVGSRQREVAPAPVLDM